MSRFRDINPSLKRGGRLRKINREEQSIINSWKMVGVIEKINTRLLREGVLILCGDCDRSADQVRWPMSRMEENGHSPRLHLIALNGGPLNLVYPHYGSDQAANAAVQGFINSQIRGSLRLKNLRRVIAQFHWPCGQAGVWGLSLQEAAEMTRTAVEKLRCSFAGAGNADEVVASIHLHKEDGLNTYHFRPHRLRGGQFLK